MFAHIEDFIKTDKWPTKTEILDYPMNSINLDQRKRKYNPLRI